jgi:Beta-propeller repeat
MPKGAASAEGTDNRAKAPSLGRVLYQGLWEGISLTYGSTKDAITESTYHIAPGADVSRIPLRYNVPVQKQTDGSLKLAFNSGFMTESAPVAWQEIGGKRVPVEVSFRVSGGEVGFSVAKYDSNVPLTIDPMYLWHTFYGSSSVEDDGNGIAVDGSGNVYITGYSGATWDGPGPTSPLNPYSGDYDIFVLKMSSFSTDIPTMNEWGMIIFMALAGLGSAYYLRRQRRA